jgi:hypothetical protein
VYAITKGMPSPRMTKEEFKQRFLNQFQDQSFDSLTAELDRVAEAAWTLMRMRENLHTPGRAGTGYADPDYDLALDCLFPGDFEDFDPGPGFHISLKDQRLRVMLWTGAPGDRRKVDGASPLR